MASVAKLTREDILSNLDELRENEEFLRHRDAYLRHAIDSLDCELVEKLLGVGANPNQSESWGDDLLHGLVHEYRATKTTKGPLIIQVLELLLAHGADPNHVGAGNWRAIDGCIERHEDELVRLFVKYGAEPNQREYV